MFIGKLSYGIAQAFIIVAGMVKMNLRKFFSYGALVAVAQYGTLLILGYFFGNAFGGKLSVIIENLQYVIAGVILVMSGYYIFSWYLRRKFPD
jgi:membrane protein DedA with SNARE-associated domain